MLRHVHEAVTTCIDAAVKARSQRQKARHLCRLLLLNLHMWIPCPTCVCASDGLPSNGESATSKYPCMPIPVIHWVITLKSLLLKERTAPQGNLKL